MRIHLIAIGQKMPAWVKQGYEEYAKRIPRENPLVLHEIAAPRSSAKGEPARRVEQEGERLLAAVPRDAWLIAFDERGRSLSTRQLADQLSARRQHGEDLALLIGGADGLSSACKSAARELWSLSALTLPHPLVRVVIAEQIYRASTLLAGHPYHRDGLK